MPDATLVCAACGHTRSQHIAPEFPRLYWRCTERIGHPWDGPCECHERDVRWVKR